jgi:hypothetical protein
MANTLKLVGNSIELNRNLSSGDGGVLGPFTIQATQNGMSAAANFNLTVSGASAAGPVPLPSPYPLQPGFIPISDPSRIIGPGNYQLTADVPHLNTIQTISNITIDGAGFTVGNSIVTSAQNVTVKNCHINGNFTVNGSNTTITNCWAADRSGISTSNVTVSHCLLSGSDASVIDDLIFTIGGPPVGPSLSNLNFLNNIVQNTFDVGLEGFGGWDHCTFSGNYFANMSWAMGGVYDRLHNNGFTTYCTFQNNTVQSSGAYANHLFIFNYVVADDDATANSLWGGSGTSLVNNNTFSGNVRQ